MNKQQAAEFFGVSVRALERYVQQGRISVKYEKGKTYRYCNTCVTIMVQVFESVLIKNECKEINIIMHSKSPVLHSKQLTIKHAIESRQNMTEPQQQSGKPVL